MMDASERFGAMLAAMIGEDELEEMVVTFEEDDEYHYLMFGYSPGNHPSSEPLYYPGNVGTNEWYEEQEMER
jgi:hypothetical protein